MNKEEKFLQYYNYLIEENQKYNLTSITDKEEAYIKHFSDSLEMEQIVDLDQDISICDVGSGAGFPGVPLKIEHDSLSLTIIEPIGKRVKFLNSLVSLLDLDKVNVINARAEDYGKENRSEFDIVCARAVSDTSILLELLAPLCKVNGRIILYKGDKGKEELDKASNAIKLLNLNVEQVYEYSLAKDMGKRMLIVLKKKKEINNKYPRRYAEIKHKPL